ncbi:hypothetical protein RRG08_000081 [Elysia crispata]|nr:hypothetical protein RRG08_000081 [Elysia crispata]
MDLVYSYEIEKTGLKKKFFFSFAEPSLFFVIISRGSPWMPANSTLSLHSRRFWRQKSGSSCRELISASHQPVGSRPRPLTSN